MINLEQEPNKIQAYILELPFKDQSYQIALWINTLKFLEDMRKRPIPTPPPRVIEYNNYSPQVRKTMNGEPEKYASFWNDPQVKNYFDQREYVKAMNWRNLKELCWTRDILKDEPRETLNALNSLINEYQDTMEHPEPIHYRKQNPPPTDQHWQD